MGGKQFRYLQHCMYLMVRCAGGYVDAACCWIYCRWWESIFVWGGSIVAWRNLLLRESSIAAGGSIAAGDLLLLGWCFVAGDPLLVGGAIVRGLLLLGWGLSNSIQITL